MESGRPAVDNVHNIDTRHKHEKHDIRVDKKGRVYVEGLVESEVSWKCMRLQVLGSIISLMAG